MRSRKSFLRYRQPTRQNNFLMHVPFIIFHFDLLIRSQRHGGNKQTNSFYCKIQLIKLFNWCCRLINRILAVGCTSCCRKENEWKADKSVIEKSLNKHQDWVFAIFNTSRAEWSGCKGLSKRFSFPFYFYEDLFKRRKKTATTTELAVWVILKAASFEHRATDNWLPKLF